MEALIPYSSNEMQSFTPLGYSVFMTQTRYCYHLQKFFFFFFFSGWGEEAQTVICNLSLHFTDLAESFGINLKLCIAYIENDMAYQFHSLWRFYFTCRVWKQNKKILNRLRRESHGSM